MAVIAAAAGLLVVLAAPAMLPKSATLSESAWLRLVDARHDDQAYVAAKVLSGEVAEADVVVLGTSSAREALWPEGDLQAALVERGGAGQKDAGQKIVNLTSSAQSPLEALFLVTLGPSKPGQLYVIFLGFGALQYDDPFARLDQGAFLVAPEHLLDAYPPDELYPRRWTTRPARLMLRWRALQQRLQRQIRFGLKSWVRGVVYGMPAAPYQPFLYQDTQHSDVPNRAAQLQETGIALRQNFGGNLPGFIRALDLLAGSVRQRGSRLVIVSPPDAAPELRTTHPGEFAHFAAAVQAVARRHGVEVLDWNEQIAWNRETAVDHPIEGHGADFIDASHVSAAGRYKWSAAFVAWLQHQHRQ